jgi:hypothetical protein
MEYKYSSIDKKVDTTDKDKLFSIIDSNVKDSESETGEWLDKQKRWHKMRMRIKKAKTFPFPGSSNLRMPTADSSIKKAKASVMGRVFGVRPIVQALPTPSGSWDTAQKLEKFLDHLCMDRIGLEPIGEILVDQSMEKGFILAKPYWKREIIERKEVIDIREMPFEEVMSIFNGDIEAVVEEAFLRFDVDRSDLVYEDNLKAIVDAIEKVREGYEKITFTFKDVTKNFPDVSIVEPERFKVRANSGYRVEDLQEGTHEFFMPVGEVKRCAEYKGWDLGDLDLDNVKTKEYSENLVDHEKDEREGITRLREDNLVRVWETYGWFDIDGDGKEEKCLVTSFPDFKRIVRKVLIETLSGEYPFVKFYYELSYNRWYAHRGVIEMTEDIIKEIDTQHNMKIDSQTLRNAPMFMFRPGMVNPNAVRLMPSQAIPVQGVTPFEDALKVMDFHNPNVEFSYEREQMILETKIQELTGIVDYSLNSMINKRQPRTLGEVEAQASDANRVFSLDVSHYTQAFTKLIQKIYELWCEYGEDEYEFNYFGERSQGETIKLSREEIQGSYRIVIRGNDSNTNPQVKLQKSSQILAAVTNPLFHQMGIITPQAAANGLKRYLQSLDVENWEEIVNLQPQPPQSTDVKVNFKDLEDGEKAQVLQKKGIQIDAKGRYASKNIENIERAAQIANQIG